MGSDGLIPKVPKMYPKPASVDKLTADQWTLYDKITFGGLGYGAFVLPSNFFIITFYLKNSKLSGSNASTSTINVLPTKLK